LPPISTLWRRWPSYKSEASRDGKSRHGLAAVETTTDDSNRGLRLLLTIRGNRLGGNGEKVAAAAAVFQRLWRHAALPYFSMPFLHANLVCRFALVLQCLSRRFDGPSHEVGRCDLSSFWPAGNYLDFKLLDAMIKRIIELVGGGTCGRSPPR
jgi:hypothetical protein